MKRIIKIMLVMFVLVWCLVACNPDAEEIDWENIELGEVLPEPQSNLMEILINDKERINVTICEITENDYLEYKRWCEDEKGFTIDIENYGIYFCGYNQEGYYLSLSYNDTENEMRIELQIPIEMGEYELPEFASMAGLPLLESKLGKFNWQKEDAFFLYVGDMDKVEYDSYKDRCVDAGFVNEVNEGDVHYTAINDNGYKLSLSYEGYNTIKVELHCPENKEEIEQSKTTTESMTTIEITTNINENTEEKNTSKIENAELHNSEYDKAFVRECTEYDIYYMFDEDTNEVINFVTNDSYVMRGIYSGSFASGVDINWVDDGWHETFKNNEGSSKATLMDGNGFEWEFKDYDVDKAQKVLDKLY